LALNVYEGLFIFDSNRYGRDQVGVSGQIAELVTKLGGEVLVSRLWEERRLAYPINGQRKGTYWLTYFKLDGRQLTAFERECQLSESILRSLTLKVEPRIVEALVAHAQSAGADLTRSRRPEGVKPAQPVEEAPGEEEEVAELG
jgi:small subunit ribosomal protein S6